jgi:hypothetical protein
MKKIKQININYVPLNEAFSLTVESGSLLQVHSADKNEYFPDRQITPLVIVPRFEIHDASGVIGTGDKTGDLTDVRWYENTELAANMITSGTNYTIGTGGKLTVKKNVAYLSPVILLFTANYYDIRTGNVLRIHESVTLSTTSLFEYPIVLDIDHPASWTFNPLTDSGLRNITARLRLAGQTVEPDEEKYWWYRLENNNPVAITDDDLFYESGQNTNVLTIDPRYVDGSIRLAVKADYIAPGKTVPANPTAQALSKTIIINRAYSQYNYDYFVHGGGQIASEATEIKAEGYVTVMGNVYQNPTTQFTLKWELKSQVYGAEWRVIGYGEQAIIPKSEYKNGANIAFDVSEKEALKAITIDGDEITFNNQILTA